MPRSSNATVKAPAQRRTMERLLTAEEVATFLGIPLATLYQWRHKGCGPHAYRVGRHLRYEPAALVAWLDGHRADSHGSR